MKRPWVGPAACIAAVAALVPGDDGAARPRSNCFEGTADAGPGCDKLPTSLPCLQADEPCCGPELCFDGDMESNCGFKRVFIFIVIPCGPPSASGAC